METIDAFYLAVRANFPELSVDADREYLKYWGENYDIDPYSWFQSLAKAVNAEMQMGLGVAQIDAIFKYIDDAFLRGSEEVKNCIDVSFVENLFWRVAPQKAEPYWQILPEALKRLYLGFHAQPPL